MNNKDKANALKRLTEDDTFNMLIQDVKERQVQVFLNPNSNGAERDEAHHVVVAINKIVDYIDAVIADDIMNDRNK